MYFWAQANTYVKDFRRYLRPFFLDPVTQQPTSLKPYYDVSSYVVTQLAFSFAAAPFFILDFSDSIKVWARVYFYAVAGVGASMVFFASPAKGLLKKKIEERSAAVGGQFHKRNASTESLASGGSMDREALVGPGLSSDMNRDLGELYGEARLTWAEKQRLLKAKGIQAKGGKVL